MKSQSIGGVSARFYAMCMVIALTLSLTLITPGYALKASTSSVQQQERSTDRDNPTPLASNKVSDALDGSDDEYFYKFDAGPGKVSVTFEVKASGTNAGAYLDLYDANARPILSDVLAQGVDRGSERVVQNIQLGRRQTIIMRIKGIRYGASGGQGIYTVTLSGAVNIDSPKNGSS